MSTANFLAYCTTLHNLGHLASAFLTTTEHGRCGGQPITMNAQQLSRQDRHSKRQGIWALVSKLGRCVEASTSRLGTFLLLYLLLRVASSAKGGGTHSWKRAGADAEDIVELRASQLVCSVRSFVPFVSFLG